MIHVRQAQPEDEPELRRVDLATWSSLSSPDTPPDNPDEYRFFGEGRESIEQVLVGVRDGAIAGYVKLTPATSLPSNQHVRMINGLGVAPEHQGAGVGQALIEAAVEKARQLGARKVSLRVLGHNHAARQLYERCGFVVEAVLKDEFHLDGRYVDDLFMARHLA
ncbi:MAG TPA: GNAT family N-acetyltransferase [Kineosporiaceae bacterium]|nr:GNAT family N-acetyltransferase [Kineosporiaceae bacterium]